MLPFRERSFNVMTLMSTLEYVSDLKAFLESVIEKLQEKGVPYVEHTLSEVLKVCRELGLLLRRVRSYMQLIPEAVLWFVVKRVCKTLGKLFILAAILLNKCLEKIFPTIGATLIFSCIRIR